MSYKTTMSGKFALIEHLPIERAIILIFETPFNITGQCMASVGAYGVESISEINRGESMIAAFDARSVLTYGEDIEARKKSKATLSMGNYNGKGILEDSKKCNFEFSSDILPGEWQLLYSIVKKNGLILLRVD